MNVREDNFPEHKVQEKLDDDGLARRLQRNTFIFLGLAMLATLIKGFWHIAAGVALGGALALFNKRWLEGSIRVILSEAVEMPNGRVPPWTASKLILRYLILAISFGIAIWTGIFHPLGMAIGFASFVGGVMIEAGYQIFLALKSNRSE